MRYTEILQDNYRIKINYSVSEGVFKYTTTNKQTIINMSLKTLTSVEGNVVSKGVNFTTAPTKVPALETISKGEAAIFGTVIL